VLFTLLPLLIINTMAAEPNFSYKQGQTENGTGKAPMLTEEEREQLKQELIKTESEIATLRIVLQTREKEAFDLKRRLGLSPWLEFADDINQGLNKVKQSDAYTRTNEILQHAGDKVTQTLGQLKGSSMFRTFESKIGAAYTNVKARVTPSPSTDFGAAGQTSAPATPMTDKAPPSSK